MLNVSGHSDVSFVAIAHLIFLLGGLIGRVTLHYFWVTLGLTFLQFVASILIINH